MAVPRRRWSWLVLAAGAVALAAAPPAHGQAAATTRPAVENAAPAAPDDAADDPIELVTDVLYASVERDDGRRADLTFDAAFLKRSDGRPMPVVVYIHGGGYARGSKEAGRVFTRVFARGGYFALSIDYRLAPAWPYPAAVHDCKAAIRFLRAHAGELGIDPDRIGVWGHSAGGHLSSLLAVSGDVAELAGPGAGDHSSAVACAVTVSGPSDFTQPTKPRARMILANWFGADEQTYQRHAREASSVRYVDGGDPPLLIVHGRADGLVPVEQAELLHEAMRAAGASSQLMLLEGEGHAVTDPDAYRWIAAFFDEHLGGRVGDGLRQAVVERLQLRDE